MSLSVHSCYPAPLRLEATLASNRARRRDGDAFALSLVRRRRKFCNLIGGQQCAQTFGAAVLQQQLNLVAAFLRIFNWTASRVEIHATGSARRRWGCMRRDIFNNFLRARRRLRDN